MDSTISAAKLFEQAKLWFAQTFNSANDVIQLSDKEAGQLVGKGVFTFYQKKFDYGVVNYGLTVFVKDGRYKYEMTSFVHSVPPGSNGITFGLITDEPVPPEYAGKGWGLTARKQQWLKLQGDCKSNAAMIIESLKNYMVTIKKTSDW